MKALDFKDSKELKGLAFVLLGVCLSLLSSVIVFRFGCGSITLMECGYYAGWPVPYARFDEKSMNLTGDVLFISPTL